MTGLLQGGGAEGGAETATPSQLDADYLTAPSLSVVNVSQTLTDVLQFPAGQVLGPEIKHFDTIVIFFPGNPGCIEFYREFLENCHQQSSESTGFLGVSFAGHTYRGLTGGRVFSLEDQVAHLASFVSVAHSAHPGARIVLSGHSIGAWLALRVLAQAEALGIDVAGTLLLFPTITHLVRADQAKWMKYMMLWGVRHFLASLVCVLGCVLPMWARRNCLRIAAKHHPSESRDFHATVPRMLKYHLILNSLYLAHHEMTQVRDLQPAMAEVIRRHESRIVFYYAAYDHWVPAGVPEQMKELFPSATHCRDEGGVPHAFCITHSRPIASVVASHVVAWTGAAGDANEAAPITD